MGEDTAEELLTGELGHDAKDGTGVQRVVAAVPPVLDARSLTKPQPVRGSVAGIPDVKVTAASCGSLAASSTRSSPVSWRPKAASTARSDSSARACAYAPEILGPRASNGQATRDRRAADRTVTAWARANAADLRQLIGQITALTDLPAAARAPLTELTTALADNDAAALVGPLTATHAYLAPRHPDLAARVDDVARHTGRLRRHSGDQRRNRA